MCGRTPREMTGDMENATIRRISVEQAREKVAAGSGLLVCAYDDEDKFKGNHLSGAMSLAEFRSRLPSIPKDQEIIFYCALPKEASAAGRAAEYLKLRYDNVKVLAGE